MKDFVQLISNLEQNPEPQKQIGFLSAYFNTNSDSDKIGSIFLLYGKSTKRIISIRDLKDFGVEFSEIPEWLVEESYQITGDWVETISLILPLNKLLPDDSLQQILLSISKLNHTSEIEKKEFIFKKWKELPPLARYVFNKLITGRFKSPISQQTLTESLSVYTGHDFTSLTLQLNKNWNPETDTFRDLFLSPTDHDNSAKPYPFYFKSSVPVSFESIKSIRNFSFETNRTGIRVQMIFRNQNLLIWTEKFELVTEKFPEFSVLIGSIPDGTVLDGILVAASEKKDLPSSVLQKRISQKTIKATAKQDYLLQFVAFDILEFQSHDLRNTSCSERSEMLKRTLENVSSFNIVKLSERYFFNSQEEFFKHKNKNESFSGNGFILKKKDSFYGIGESGQDWLLIKKESSSVLAVLIYAQKSQNQFSDVFSVFSFGVWKESQLVTICKTETGLSDQEKIEINEFIKQNTIEKFGPVRTVKPMLIFEIEFEGIIESSRHKVGFFLRFPKILKWRKDKLLHEIDHLETLKLLLK